MVQFGAMPVYRVFLMPASSTGGALVHAFGLLSRWNVSGGGGSQGCGLNKLVFVLVGTPYREGIGVPGAVLCYSRSPWWWKREEREAASEQI
jgi:hypothetical protein